MYRANTLGMGQDIFTNILHSVADAKGVEPNELNLVLYDYIDMDAVVQLLNAEKENWSLSFDVPEYTVTVCSDGSVMVNPKQQSQTGKPRQSVS